MSATSPAIVARRVKEWTGAITASKPAPSRSIVRPNADRARRTTGPAGVVNSNDRVKALVFYAVATVLVLESIVQRPLKTRVSEHHEVRHQS